MSLDTTLIEGKFIEDCERLGAEKATQLRSLRMYKLVMDDRQRRVRLAARAGITHTMIARELGISVRTVKREIGIFGGRVPGES
jgi:DNA-binding NarL/FixJ family response regulator